MGKGYQGGSRSSRWLSNIMSNRRTSSKNTLENSIPKKGNQKTSWKINEKQFSDKLIDQVRGDYSHSDF